MTNDSKEVLNCVYCGHEYQDGTVAYKHRKLTEHLKICPDHPLRAAEEKVVKLRVALEGLLGATSVEELSQMETFMMTAPAADRDKAACLNAIEALRFCYESAAYRPI